MKFVYDSVSLDKDWKNIPIKEKWVPVFVESPIKLSKQMRFELLMRMDSIFQGWGYSGGNNKPFLAKIHEFIRYPIKPSYSNETTSNQWKKYNEEVKNWRKDWGTVGDVSDSKILKVEMFSFSYGGPVSFFDFKTGKIAAVTGIGKWPEEVGYVEEELKEFTETFPNIPLVITVCDDSYNDKIDEELVHPLVTLKVFEGKIERIDIRTKRQLKKVLRDSNHINKFIKRKKFFNKLRFKWYQFLKNIHCNTAKMDLVLEYPYWKEESAFDEDTIMGMCFKWMNRKGD